MLQDTVTKMEKFFSEVCNSNRSTGIPDCHPCRHNEYGQGCRNEENPLNKMMEEIERKKK